jgi:hypothetical protein
MTSERQPGKSGDGEIIMVDEEVMDTGAGETSPLLGAGAEPNGPERRLSQEWDGGDDFKHLPAWRRPSVCLSYQRRSGALHVPTVKLELSAHVVFQGTEKKVLTQPARYSGSLGLFSSLHLPLAVSLYQNSTCE